jgi:hypothetical protein
MSIFVGHREIKSVTLSTRVIVSITLGERELFQVAAPVRTGDLDYFTEATLEIFAGGGDGNWRLRVESSPDTSAATRVAAGRSLDSLVHAIGNATAGDVIVLGAGTHDWSVGTWSALTKDIKLVGEAGAVVDGGGGNLGLDLEASLQCWNVAFQNAGIVWKVPKQDGLVIDHVEFHDCPCTDVTRILQTDETLGEMLGTGGTWANPAGDGGPDNNHARVRQIVYRGSSDAARVTVSGPSTGNDVTDGFIKTYGNWEKLLFENVNCIGRRPPLLYLGGEFKHPEQDAGSFNWRGPRAIVPDGVGNHLQDYGWGDCHIRNVRRTTNGVTPRGNGISFRYCALASLTNVELDYDTVGTNTDEEGIYLKVVHAYLDDVRAYNASGAGDEGYVSVKRGMARLRDCVLGGAAGTTPYALYANRGMVLALRCTFDRATDAFHKTAKEFIALPDGNVAELEQLLNNEGLSEFLVDGPSLRFVDCDFSGVNNNFNIDDNTLTLLVE